MLWHFFYGWNFQSNVCHVDNPSGKFLYWKCRNDRFFSQIIYIFHQTFAQVYDKGFQIHGLSSIHILCRVSILVGSLIRNVLPTYCCFAGHVQKPGWYTQKRWGYTNCVHLYFLIFQKIHLVPAIWTIMWLLGHFHTCCSN